MHIIYILLIFIIYTGYGPILLNLMAVHWMTTQSPSWCLGAVGDNLSVVKHNNFRITDGCYLTPFIYTALADAGLIIFTYLSYRLCSLYSFDDADNNNRDNNNNDRHRNISNNNKRTIIIKKSKRRGRSTTKPNTNTTRGNTTRGNTTRGNTRSTKKASISWIEPAHWKPKPQRHPHIAPSPAYQVEKSPTYIPSMPMKHHKESMQEPAHWNTKRKPTYEKNYS